MINIFIASLIGSMILIGNGYIFNFLIFKKKINEFNVYKDSLTGYILIGFTSLLINFFFPIDNRIGSIFLISSIIIFLYFFLKFEKKKELILILFYLSFTTFSILTYSNINRPDAGLYHLPFISILNENKLIIGLSNLHYRFGHTSIFQYISAIHTNLLFKKEFLNIPLALLPSFFLLFLYKNYFDEIKKNNQKNIVILFLIAAFSIYSFNRFSGLGNDGPANIFILILIVMIVTIEDFKNIKNIEFYNITLVSIFLIMLKPFMIFVSIVPLIIALMGKKSINLFKDKKILFISFFLILWFLKNILTSSCIIFPIKQTCLTNLTYSNEKIINKASQEAEAWAKGFPDSKDKVKFEEYNSNFNWLNTWSKNHFKKIVNKIFPLIILIIILSLNFIFKISFYKQYNLQKVFTDKKLLYIILFISLFILLWFLKFPVYRFGLSFIASFFIITFVFFFVSEENYFFNKKYFSIFLIFGMFFFYVKNFNRIISNLENEYKNAPWPPIYSMKVEEKNKFKKFKKIKNENNKFIYFFSGGEECMYSKSPCSNYFYQNLNKKKINGYEVFYFN